MKNQIVVLALLVVMAVVFNGCSVASFSQTSPDGNRHLAGFGIVPTIPVNPNVDRHPVQQPVAVVSEPSFYESGTMTSSGYRPVYVRPMWTAGTTYWGGASCPQRRSWR